MTEIKVPLSGPDVSAAEIEAVVEVMRSGRLHRYNAAEGEESVVSRLERGFAGYQDAKYCPACAPGGYAMSLAPVPDAMLLEDCEHIAQIVACTLAQLSLDVAA